MHIRFRVIVFCFRQKKKKSFFARFLLPWFKNIAYWRPVSLLCEVLSVCFCLLSMHFRWLWFVPLLKSLVFIYTVELLIWTRTVSNAGYNSQIQGVLFLITWLRAAERATPLLYSDQIMTPAVQCSLLYNTALKLLCKLKYFDLQKYKLKMRLYL